MEGREVDGAGLELERTHLGPIAEVIGHLVRNAVDHGIEAADERAASGKDPVGKIRITCRIDADDAVSAIQDDGRGIDTAAIVQERPGEDPYTVIFEPGFTTRTVATVTSGRGIGLDAVRRQVEDLGGRIDAAPNEPGTTFTLRVPRRFSLLPCVPFRQGRFTALAPISAIERIDAAGPTIVDTAGGAHGVDDVGGVILVATQALPAWLGETAYLGAAVMPDGTAAPVMRWST